MPFTDVAASPFERLIESLSMRPPASRRFIDAVVEYEPDAEHALASLRAASEARLTEIEHLEAEKARVEARLLDAYASLHTLEGEQLRALGPSRAAPVTADQVVTQEIACATGLAASDVSSRLELATAPRRHRVLRDRLREGRVALDRALRVVRETRDLPDDVVAAISVAVLAPAPDGSVPSHRLFASRLRRCVRSADRRGEGERGASAVARRGVHGRVLDDGTGFVTIVASAERVVGVLDRVDSIARRIRAGGDPRSLDQLRSDVLCDLALFGVVTPTAAVAEGGVSCTGAGAEVPYARVLGAAPPATVRIVVPFEVAAGLSDAACELPGHGWLAAAHAREIMTAPGSVWQRLAVDVDSGRALELATESYTPTAAMVAHVRAVDGVCRGPGCQVPADRCDTDHLVPWPTGPTRVTNLVSLHRACHNLKTARAWTADRDRDDGVAWTTLAGRSYVSRPRDWREALDDPVIVSRDGPAPLSLGRRPTGPGRPTAPGRPPDDPPPF